MECVKELVQHVISGLKMVDRGTVSSLSILEEGKNSLHTLVLAFYKVLLVCELTRIIFNNSFQVGANMFVNKGSLVID
jgi:hypothetical protein